MSARPATVLPFRKLHGIGNDFILFDGFSRSLPVRELVDPRRVVALCDRHRGVGADGVLLLLPPAQPPAHALMRVLNSDGTEPETCGNGIRCTVKVLCEQVAACANLDAVLVATGAGIVRCEPRARGGRIHAVRVDMGPPSLERASVGLAGEGRFVDEELVVLEGHALHATAVSLGNPHVVTFVDDPGADLRALALRLGPNIEHHPALARGANVGFGRLRGDGVLELCVWERGAGLTLACGSGACAAAVAARVTGRSDGAQLTVALPGGELLITVAADLSRVWMEGAVEEVFVGEIALP